MPAVAGHQGVPRVLPDPIAIFVHDNRSERRPSYRDVYTPRMRNAVAAVYADDIRTLDYAFD